MRKGSRDTGKGGAAVVKSYFFWIALAQHVVEGLKQVVAV